MTLLYRNKEPRTHSSGAGFLSRAKARAIKEEVVVVVGGELFVTRLDSADCSFCLSETLHTSLFEYQRGKHRMRERDLGAS